MQLTNSCLQNNDDAEATHVTTMRVTNAAPVTPGPDFPDTVDEDSTNDDENEDVKEAPKKPTGKAPARKKAPPKKQPARQQPARKTSSPSATPTAASASTATTEVQESNNDVGLMEAQPAATTVKGRRKPVVLPVPNILERTRRVTKQARLAIPVATPDELNNLIGEETQEPVKTRARRKTKKEIEALQSSRPGGY